MFPICDFKGANEMDVVVDVMVLVGQLVDFGPLMCLVSICMIK